MSIVGIDIGGSKTIVGVADENGNLINKKRLATLVNLGREQVIDSVKAAVWGLLSDYHMSSEDIDGIGVCCGGPVDAERGLVLTCPNMPGWDNVALAKIFSEEFNAPAWIDNDATVATLAELMFGAGMNVNNFVYFTVSAGIGGGIVIDRKLYRGSNGNAGEFGHQVVLPDGPPCTCGDRGCLESLSSGSSIAKRARRECFDWPSTVLLHWVDGNPMLITSEHVSRGAAEEDEFSSYIWNQAMNYLGIGVANVVNILNPELVVIGGGVTRAGELLFEPVRRVIEKRALSGLSKIVGVVPAALGDDVAVVGAITLAMERLGLVGEGL
ncbi:MAG: ROK family protein [Armatimonadota bacterium]|nr:ROK family protein [Armatimonadota bacterium]